MPEIAEEEYKKKFETWLALAMKEIMLVRKLLAAQLSSNPMELETQARMIECHYGRMTEFLADANSFLDQSEYINLLKIDRELTVMEREATLKNNVVNERRLRDKIEGITEAIKNRLILCLGLMKSSGHERSLQTRTEA